MITTLLGGISAGSVLGLTIGTVGAGLAGFLLFVLILAPAYYFKLYLDYRRRRAECSGSDDEAPDAYPEDLERVERRYSDQLLIVPLALALAAIGASWVIFGKGLYGVPVALLAMLVAQWALARFGGPDDPKWRKVRDEWRRQHMERDRAS